MAYEVATQTTRPSWGYMVSKGATTVWERWDTDTQDGGMNGESQKILSGNLEAWLYQTLGGINYDPDRPGFKHVVLRPRPVGDLSYVRASHQVALRPDRQRLEGRGGRLPLGRRGPARTRPRRSTCLSGDASTVTEGGKPAGQADGVRFLRTEADSAVYSVASGTYTFRTSLWKRPDPRK